MWFSAEGLRLGRWGPMIGVTPERLETLLAIAFRRLSAHLMRHVIEAAEVSRRGDQALANLRPALAGLSRVPAAHDLPIRLAMTDTLLAKGMTAGDLLRALDLDASSGDALAKFDPNQPRVPAGSERESGRWTSGDGGTSSDSATSVAAIASRGAPLFHLSSARPPRPR